jgi:8-oxo-dGTP pyrophosphatase MutT (NUDIX family)
VEVEDVLDAAVEVAEAAAELLKDFALGGGGMPQLVPYDLAGQWRQFPMVPMTQAVASGIAVVAQNTGRCLLMQRGDQDIDDPAGGKWEFPGGKCEQGEGAFACAVREWQEEMGVTLPAGTIAGQWNSTDGVYRGYVWLIRSEDMVDLAQRDQSKDPDGDYFEAAAWWQPSDLPGMPALREELRQQMDWNLLRTFAVNKYIFAELEKLGRYLRHNKDITKFRTSWLPEKELHLITLGLTTSSPASAVAAARGRMIGKFNIPARSQHRANQRDQALRGITVQTAAKLGALARDAHSSHLSFVDSASKVLRDAYVQAYVAGHKHAVAAKQAGSMDDPEFDDLPPDVQDDIQNDVDRQHGFLQGLTQDLVAGLAGAALTARMAQYAASVIGPYEEGYQDGAILALTPDDQTATDASESGGIMATWVVTSEDPCALCEEKNGQVWPAEEAPMPGDGDFGEQCEGAMNCRCILEYDYVPTDDSSSVANPAADFEAA